MSPTGRCTSVSYRYLGVVTLFQGMASSGPPSKRLFLIRHAESEQNEATRGLEAGQANPRSPSLASPSRLPFSQAIPSHCAAVAALASCKARARCAIESGGGAAVSSDPILPISPLPPSTASLAACRLQESSNEHRSFIERNGVEAVVHSPLRRAKSTAVALFSQSRAPLIELSIVRCSPLTARGAALCNSLPICFSCTRGLHQNTFCQVALINGSRRSSNGFQQGPRNA